MRPMALTTPTPLSTTGPTGAKPTKDSTEANSQCVVVGGGGGGGSGGGVFVGLLWWW